MLHRDAVRTNTTKEREWTILDNAMGYGIVSYWILDTTAVTTHARQRPADTLKESKNERLKTERKQWKNKKEVRETHCPACPEKCD